MSKALISIIVPVYKVEQYLDECVRSILHQSFKDFELILVDDGSPDNCPSMCDEYARQDGRVNVLHKQNGGLADARNAGIGLAECPYIAFVDSDDYLPEGALQALFDEIVSSQADIVLGKVERFIVGGGVRPYTRLHERVELTGKEALMLILQGSKINISVCGALYKREIWNGIEMPKGYICEDWYVTPDLYLRASKVVFTPAPWYMYRDNPQSTMGTLIKKCNPQVIDVCRHAIDVCKSDSEQLYSATLWSNLKRVWKFVGIIYTRGSQKEEKDCLDQVRSLLKMYYKYAYHSGKMNLQEKIGVWSFCYCEPLCELLFKLKKM